MFVRTERLFLRPAWPEDADELHAAIADSRVVRYLSRARWPYTLADARGFTARPQDRFYPNFLITLPGPWGSRVIGGIGLHEAPAGAELGYWIAHEHWGKGYATEAASAVLRLAQTLGHGPVGARPFPDDPASMRVLEKLGFASGAQADGARNAGRGSAREEDMQAA